MTSARTSEKKPDNLKEKRVTLYYFPGRSGTLQHFGHIAIKISIEDHDQYYLSYGRGEETSCAYRDNHIELAFKKDLDLYTTPSTPCTPIDLTPPLPYKSWSEIDLDNAVSDWDHRWKSAAYYVTDHNCAHSMLDFLKLTGFAINLSLLFPSTLANYMAGSLVPKTTIKEMNIENIRLTINLQIQYEIDRLHNELIFAKTKKINIFDTTEMRNKQRLLIFLYSLRDEMAEHPRLEKINEKIIKIILYVDIDEKTKLNLKKLATFIGKLAPENLEDEAKKSLPKQVIISKKQKEKNACLENYAQIETLLKEIKIVEVTKSINNFLRPVHQNNLVNIAKNQNANIDIYKPITSLLLTMLYCRNIQAQLHRITHKQDLWFEDQIVASCFTFVKAISRNLDTPNISPAVASNDTLKHIHHLKSVVHEHFKKETPDHKLKKANLAVTRIKTPHDIEWIIHELKNILFWYQENEKTKNLSAIRSLLIEAYKIKYQVNLTPIDAFAKIHRQLDHYVQQKPDNLGQAPEDKHTLTRALIKLLHKINQISHKKVPYDHETLTPLNQQEQDKMQREKNFHLFLDECMKNYIKRLSNLKLQEHLYEIIDNLKKFTENRVLNTSDALMDLVNEINHAKSIKTGLIIRKPKYSRDDIGLLEQILNKLAEIKAEKEKSSVLSHGMSLFHH